MKLTIFKIKYIYKFEFINNIFMFIIKIEETFKKILLLLL